MKRFILLIILFSVLLIQNNILAAPPEHAANDWEARIVTKIGFSSNGLSAAKLQNYTTIQDSDFDFVKVLDTPAWHYIDYNTPATAHVESIGTLSGIPVGSYYVYVYYTEFWFHTVVAWIHVFANDNRWMAAEFCLNGSCVWNNSIYTTINPSDFIKVTIGNNQTANLTQTLTDVTIAGADYTYTYSAQSSTQ